MACFISCGKSEHKSEDKMFAHFRDHLPEDWIVLGNVPLVGHDRDLEVDAVIICPGKIWVVEGKCWRGDITGDQLEWVQNGKSRPSPLRSLGGKARKLASAVRECGINLTVTSLVVMLANQSDYTLNIENDPSVVTCVHHLKDVVKNVNNQRKSQYISAEQLHVLVKRLGGIRAEDAYIKYLSIFSHEIIPEIHIKHTSSKQTKKENETLYLITLSGKGGFTRTYYSCDYTRILIGHNELRGSEPSVWNNWSEEGVLIRFSNNGVGFEAASGTHVMLNGTHRLHSKTIVKPSSDSGYINVGGIDLKYDIETIKFD